MSVIRLNTLDEPAARSALGLCCVSRRWIDGVLSERPYANFEALRDAANSSWDALVREDYLEAFEGHPRIGDVGSLKAKYAASSNLASHEQDGVSTASDAEIARLAEGNQRYEARFGYIFIVCATGKSALEMCELLEARLANDAAAELAIAAEEQRKILHIRLEQWQ